MERLTEYGLIEEAGRLQTPGRPMTYKTTDEFLRHYTFMMFEWLQDMNWLGAQIIWDRLLNMPADMISHAFQHSLKQAQALADEPWLLCLSAFRKAYEGGTRTLV